jgi:hypothetical protein
MIGPVIKSLNKSSHNVDRTVNTWYKKTLNTLRSNQLLVVKLLKLFNYIEIMIVGVTKT